MSALSCFLQISAKLALSWILVARSIFGPGSFVISPYLGPFVASFITSVTTWRWTFYLLAILSAVCWILVIALIDETYYNRAIPEEKQPPRKSRLLRLIGVEQWQSRHQRITFARAVMRPFVTIIKLPVLFIFGYYTFTFAWVIGLNTQISVFLTNPKLYNFTPHDLGES